MAENRLKRFLLYFASAAAAAALLHVLLRCLLPWLLPFLLAAAAAWAMEPAVRFLQTRAHFRRGFSSLLLTLFVLFVLGGLLSLLISALTGEARSLLERAPALLAAVPQALESLLERVRRYAAVCPPWLAEQMEETLLRYAAGAEDLLGTLLARVPGLLGSFAAALPGFFLGAATSVLAVYFTSSDLPEILAFLKKRFSTAARQKLRHFRDGMSRSAARWLRAELTLCAVTFTQLLLVLLFLREPYALLLAFFITLVDALPVFGTGTVLIPWGIIEMLLHNFPKSIALLLLYLLTLTVRSVLEPRLLGAQAGLPPIASLLAMYLGFRAFGVAGMVLLPFFLLFFAQLRRQAEA